MLAGGDTPGAGSSASAQREDAELGFYPSRSKTRCLASKRTPCATNSKVRPNKGQDRCDTRIVLRDPSGSRVVDGGLECTGGKLLGIT